MELIIESRIVQDCRCLYWWLESEAIIIWMEKFSGLTRSVMWSSFYWFKQSRKPFIFFFITDHNKNIHSVLPLCSRWGRVFGGLMVSWSGRCCGWARFGSSSTLVCPVWGPTRLCWARSSSCPARWSPITRRQSSGVYVCQSNRTSPRNTRKLNRFYWVCSRESNCVRELVINDSRDYYGPILAVLRVWNCDEFKE